MADKSKPDMWAALFAAGLGREQHKQIQYNSHTQVLVQVLQALALALALPGLLFGLYLLADGRLWLVERAADEYDRLFLAVMISAGGAITWGLVGLGVRRAGRELSLWATLARALVTVGLVLLACDLVAILADDWETARSARLLGGLGLVLATALLIWRFGNELWNPTYPKSPMIGLLQDFLTPDEPPPVEILQPYPIRMNNKTRGADVLLPDPDDDALDEEADGPPIYRVDPEFEDLVAFVRLAQRRGLARSALLTKPRTRMPSGQRLTRDYYDRMIALAREPWGIVQLGGSGSPAEWAVDVHTALRMLDTTLTHVQAGGRAE